MAKVDPEKQVRDYFNNLRELPKEILKTVNKEVDLVKESQKTLDQGRDPYKKKWQQRKQPASHPILNKSGELRKNFKQETIRDKIVVKNIKSYAKAHQKGTKHLVKRIVLPTELDGLPDHWVKMIEEAIADLIKKDFN